MNKIGKNFFLNIIYQILVLVVPLVTTPYISRVFGPTRIGVYSYTFSIANYFLLFAMLGVSNLGSREIAKSKSNKILLSRTFNDLYFMQLISSGTALAIYILFLFFIEKDFLIYGIAQIPYLLSAVFDITWLFFGIEKFKTTVIRNVLIKLASTVSIFIFVKKPEDLLVYTLILSFSFLISQLSLWPIVSKVVDIKLKGAKLDFIKLKTNFILFIPVIAVSVYRISSKILLGHLGSVTDVGYYENANKLVNLPLGIVAALGVIMIPRISILLSENKHSQALKITNQSLTFIIALASILFFGLSGIAPEFVPVFFGLEFLPSESIVYILAPSIIFIAIANVIRTQLLIPMEKDRHYVQAVVLGAIINIILNVVLIPKFGAVGSAVATLVAEVVVCIVQLLTVRKELLLKQLFINIISFMLFGLIAYMTIRLVATIEMPIILKIALEIVIGSLVYVTLIVIFRRDIFDLFLNIEED